MQSLRQYQKFKQNVRAQHERYGEKVTKKANQPSEEEPMHVKTSSQQSIDDYSADISDSRNREKEGELGNGNENGNVLGGVEVCQAREHLATKCEGTLNQPSRDFLLEKDLQQVSVFLIDYKDEKDPMNPRNWSYTTRFISTSIITFITFVVGFASSIESSILIKASTEFGVSKVVGSLATGLYLGGLGFGALLAGPISETIGRNPVYIVTLVGFMLCITVSALALNIKVYLGFKFLAGVFGSTPLVCAGGSISDLWNPIERVFVFPIFATVAFLGPIFGPVIGGFIGQSNMSWRWTEWITLIASGITLISVVLFLPETFPPILAKWKASNLQRITGDKQYMIRVSVHKSLWKRLIHALYRPFVLMIREPIILLFAIYLTIIWIILFTFLNGYTYIYGKTYGFSRDAIGLAFLGIVIGIFCGGFLTYLMHYYSKCELKIQQNKYGLGASLPPEQRLWFAMFGAPAIPISLFWMAWTNNSKISYWSDLAASILFGYGVLCIFISTYQYIIDSYTMNTASALASLTFMRYVAAGAIVELGILFYTTYEVHWVLTVLGIMSALMVPIPYLFYIYGLKIRKDWSKYALDSNA